MSNEKYELGVDYPPPGKRHPAFIGYEERDEQDGWVWRSTFETAHEGVRIAEENREKARKRHNMANPKA